MEAVLRKLLVSPEKYDIKCPYSMSAETITVHNTANDASAENEVKYMIGNSNQVSYHIAVDDKEAVQGIPLDRNTWHAGDGVNGKGNRESIGIEICYSKSGGEKFIKAEKNAAELIAGMLKERGWGIDRVKKHQDWSGKYCPHRTLDMGWQRFLDMIRDAMNPNSNTGNDKPDSQPNGGGYTGNSIVDYLDSIGKDSSFAARKRYAAQYGITGYTGTSSQNLGLLNKMRSGSKPAAPTLDIYYKKYTGNSGRVDEVLAAIDVPSAYRGSWLKRKPLANKNGIIGYIGTAGQNNKLIGLAKDGKLKRV